jgi:5-formyltetrahydrofolate cyclo-ligase
LVKKEIREEALAKRIALTKADFWQLNDQLLEQIKAFNWSSINCLHIFLPIKEKKEIDTFDIISYFKIHHPDIKIVVPRSDFENITLANVLFDHEHTILVKNKYQIPEPLYGKIISSDKIDAVLVPLLAFDNIGNRIGYGAGFYDRLLSTCKLDCKRIGLSFFNAQPDLLPTEPFDQLLTHCITSERTYIF